MLIGFTHLVYGYRVRRIEIQTYATTNKVFALIIPH